MRVSAILKGRKDKEGRQTIQIRVNDGKKRTFFPLKIKVKDTQFKEGKVIKHPQAEIFNQKIKAEIGNRELSPEKVIDPDFFTYARKCISYWRDAKIKGSARLRHYESFMNKMSVFKKSFRLSEMDNPFFRGFLTHLYSIGNSQNTAWENFSKLHAILEQAVDDNLLPKNPLNEFKDFPKYKDPFPHYLTDKQLKDVEKYALTVDSEAKRTGTLWFLIGCYTALRYSDMVSFDKKKHIVEGRLIKSTIKTSNIVSLPVEGQIKRLFELVEYKPLTITNEAYNRILKVIGKECGIDINMTVHVSRHTFGMRCANAGISIEVTAALMGHKSIRHTAIYYRVSNMRVDKEIAKIL